MPRSRKRSRGYKATPRKRKRTRYTAMRSRRRAMRSVGYQYGSASALAAPAPVVTPLPGKKTIKMRYCDTRSVSAGFGGVPVHFTYRANSIFDPDYGVGGHQPLGHDEWAKFYNKYVVTRAKITVTLLPDNQAAGTRGIWGIQLGTNNSVGADDIVLREQSQGVYRNYAPASDNSSWKDRSLTMTVDPSKYFNIKNIRDDSLSRASFGANPTRDVFFLVFGSNTQGAAQTDFLFDVTIDYEVSLSDTKRLLPS